VITNDWLIDYNEQHLHDALGGLSHATFMEQQTIKNSTFEKRTANGPFRLKYFL